MNPDEKKQIGKNQQAILTELIQEHKPSELIQGHAKPKISKCKLPNVFLNSKKKIGKQQIPQKNQNEIKTDKIKRKNPQQNISVKTPQVKKSQKVNKNPLIPIKNSIKYFQQIQEQLDFSANQIFQKLQKYKSSSYKIIKIEQCLTLNYVRKLKNNGCVKKILHIPSFKVYYLQQQPIHIKDDKIIIKEWLENWEKCPINDYQLKNYGLYWNTPQGFLSLIYQYPQHKTLKDLLESSEFLPQNLLQKIVHDLISGLDFLKKNGINYPNIEQSQFLFDENGKLKFYPNLQLDSKHSSINNQDILTNKYVALSSNSNQLQIAKIGLMCFKLAVGSFIIEQELLQILQAIINKNEKNQNCCILHLLSKNQQKLHLYKKSKCRWSPEFIDFLCGSLKFDQKRRSTIQLLKNHKFLTKKDCLNKVELMDLINLTKQQPSTSSDIVKGSEARFNNVLEAIQCILATLKNTLTISIKKQSTAVKCISEQTGLDVDFIFKQITKIYDMYNNSK